MLWLGNVYIPCEHACVVAMYLRKNIVDLVTDVFKYPTQEKVYAGMLRGIETYNIPKVDDDSVVWDVVANVFFFLKPSRTKRPQEDQGKSASSRCFKISGPCIIPVAIWPVIVEKHEEFH